MEEKEIKKKLATTSEGIIQKNDSEYVRLVSHISGLWEKAKEKVIPKVSDPQIIISETFI